ncbi:hypothetical protein [Helicobacter ailurogastricus]|uniref:hypothetical protein n=1 Tax=Helicobacter ailurogastricus TaxID=1578720 RepID=UPI0006B4C1DA|nr:hypothetical protein [Helicobacter ailurogastricus]
MCSRIGPKALDIKPAESRFTSLATTINTFPLHQDGLILAKDFKPALCYNATHIILRSFYVLQPQVFVFTH